MEEQKIQNELKYDEDYYHEKAEKLIKTGITVIKYDWFVNNIDKLRKMFINALRKFPEYKRNPEKPDYTPTGEEILYVLGGFSALGNPSSFHNTFVRRLRQWMMSAVVPLFIEFNKIKGTNYKLEQIIDRMLYRLKGQKVTEEKWHRDEAITETDDITFGGWINLDKSQDQFLSCLPNTHIKSSSESGFKNAKEEAEKLIEAGICSKKKIVIPAGHIMIFYENTIHEVVGKKPAQYNLRRVFFGWRLTNHTKPLFDNMDELLEKQAPMYLKSGQGSAIYSKMHVNFRNKWDKYTNNIGIWANKTFVDKVLGGQYNGPKIVFTKHKQASAGTDKVRQMLSLEEYGLPKYKKYTKTEKQLHKPNKSWSNLLQVGSKTETLNISM